jgi:tape measure domain-containing protein
MADTEDLDILIRLRGGRVAASEAKAVDKALAGIGESAKTTAKQTENLNQGQRRLGLTFGNTIGIAIRYAAAYQAIHLATRALASGFNFNSTIEQNTVAFTHFLGSTQLATAYLGQLYQLAATTPFEFSQVTMAAKRMLAFGFTAQEATDDLRVLADAASGLGIGSEGIDRLTIALGQMKAKGFVSGDELLQLTEAGINATKYLTDAGLIAQKDLGNIGAKHIDAAKGIAAIIAGMQRDFGGMSAAQAKTWQGQLSTIKDYAAQAAGALTKPIFDLGRSSILPAISTELQKWTKYLNAGGAEDIYRTMGNILRILGPLVGALVAYKLALLGVAAAEFAVAKASAVMAIASTLSTVILLIPAVTSLGDAFVLLSFAVEALGLSIAAVSTLGIAALIAGLVYAYVKVQWFRDAVNSVFEFIRTHWALLAVLMTGPIGAIVVPIIKNFEAIKDAFKGVINFIIRAWNSLHFDLPSIHAFGHTVGGGRIGVPQIKTLANGGDVRPGGVAISGEAGPELLENRGGVTRVTPLGGGHGGGRTLQPLIVQIEGRTFAKVMVDLAQTAAARG